jgi:hypothetical protein
LFVVEWAIDLNHVAGLREYGNTKRTNPEGMDEQGFFFGFDGRSCCPSLLLQGYYKI